MGDIRKRVYDAEKTIDILVECLEGKLDYEKVIIDGELKLIKKDNAWVLPTEDDLKEHFAKEGE